MAGRWFLVGLVVFLSCFLIATHSWAGLLDSDIDYGTSQPWDGFDEDFSPDWEGKTTWVGNWQETNIGGTSTWIASSGTLCVRDFNYNGVNSFDATILGTNWRGPGHWEESGHWESRPTVRKVSSSSDSNVSNDAWIRSAGREYSATKNDTGGSEMSRYARLVSPPKNYLVPNGLYYELQTVDEKLLVESASIAYRNSDFGDDSFSVDGRVSAETIVLDTPEPLSAHATGQSWFKSTYELDRDTDFTLDIDLAIRGQIYFSVTATDVATGEEAFCLKNVYGATNEGSQQNVGMTGTLEAGEYEFVVNCETDASINAMRQLNPGGQAEFDVSLDLLEEYVQVWVPEKVWVSDYNNDACVVKSGCIYRIAPLTDLIMVEADLSEPNAVPEPSTFAMLILGGLACLIARRRR